MKLTKTEEKLLRDAARKPYKTVCVMTCYGRGCRKNGEGQRSFNAYIGLKDKGLIENTDRVSHTDYRAGYGTHVTEYWGKLSPLGIETATQLENERCK